MLNIQKICLPKKLWFKTCLPSKTNSQKCCLSSKSHEKMFLEISIFFNVYTFPLFPLQQIAPFRIASKIDRPKAQDWVFTFIIPLTGNAPSIHFNVASISFYSLMGSNFLKMKRRLLILVVCCLAYAGQCNNS